MSFLLRNKNRQINKEVISNKKKIQQTTKKFTRDSYIALTYQSKCIPDEYKNNLDTYTYIQSHMNGAKRK